MEMNTGEREELKVDKEEEIGKERGKRKGRKTGTGVER